MIPHSKPLIHPDDIRTVTEVLESGMLAGGERVRLFEQALTAYIGVSHAAAVSSGTAGLYLALRALDIGPGDEVVIPAYACSALLYAVRLAGATPLLADTGKDGIHPDGETIKRALTPRAKAVFFAHLFGHACDLRDIIALGVPVIEDCAMAPGAVRCGHKAGALGSAAAVFSFYATKVISSGEGGMVLSHDAAFIDRVRDRADYADKVDAISRFNLKMTDLAAALGNSQLGRLEFMIARRRELAARYMAAFSGTGMELPFEEPDEKCIFYRYAVGTRHVEQLRAFLHARGIRAERPVFASLSRYPGLNAECPGAEKAWKRTLSIPLYPALVDEEAESIIRAVREFHADNI
jgi:dTDP-4-amino-4,6-dideoxygalactose transaminase